MHIKGDHAELVVGGRLDVRSAADARTSLHTALDGGQGDLVLDLGGLDSWDATGLGVIMGAHRRAGRCGRRLVLRSVPSQMQRLLVATRLHRILTIEGSGAQTPYDAGGQADGQYPGGAQPNGAQVHGAQARGTQVHGAQVHGAQVHGAQARGTYSAGAYAKGPYAG